MKSILRHAALHGLRDLDDVMPFRAGNQTLLHAFDYLVNKAPFKAEWEERYILSRIEAAAIIAQVAGCSEAVALLSMLQPTRKADA